MTKLRTMLIAGVAMLSLAVAGPAMASEFVSTGGAATGTGEEQSFQLGPFKITCKKVKASGGSSTPLASETFNTSLKFSGCSTLAFIGRNPVGLKTRFLTPMDVEYHANGFVEIGSEFEQNGEGYATLSGGTIELKVPALKSHEASPRNCVITMPTQPVPRKAKTKPLGEYEEWGYSNEEEEVGHHQFTELLLENEWRGIAFEYSGGQCENFPSDEEERHSGRFTGELLEKIAGRGSIEFKET